MQADGELKPGMRMPMLHAVRCNMLLPCIQLYGHANTCAGKKGVSLQQPEWQELRRDDGSCVQAAIDSLLLQSAAGGPSLLPMLSTQRSDCWSRQHVLGFLT
jgi:hypothetical protein